MPTALDQRQGFDLAAHHTERFLDYVSVLDDDQLALPVPGLTWTVAEVIAHVRSVFERYTIDQRRGVDAADVGVVNAEDVVRLGTDVREAVASIREQLGRLEGFVDLVEPDQRFPFHAGAQITMTQGWANLLGELLAHGDDLARATEVPFAIPGEDLAAFWTEGAAVLGPWLTEEAQGIDETWELRFGFGTTFLRIVGGGVVLDPAPADHVVEVGDAAEFTLAFPYRRRAAGTSFALLASRFREL